MIKKTLVAMIAAGALSVPLAGVAWGDPGPSDPNGNGIGPGGVPEKIAKVLEQQGVSVVGNVPPGTGNDSPGVTIFGNSDIAKLDGSVPDNLRPGGIPNAGAVVRAVTPGCDVNSSIGCR